MVFLKKNPYKSPKIRIYEKIRTSIRTKTDFLKKIHTCRDKSVQVGTLVGRGRIYGIMVGWWGQVVKCITRVYCCPLKKLQKGGSIRAFRINYLFSPSPILWETLAETKRKEG